MPECSVCGRPSYMKKGSLCRPHYEAAKANGTIPIKRKSKEAFELVIERVDKAANGCWNFNGHLAGGNEKSRYGVISFRYRNHYAHRVMFEKYKGNIPDGLQVCHSCDNTLCCNPDHLFLGTSKENHQDSVRKKRRAVQQRAA